MENLVLRNLFGGAYEGRRVLVTGHTGFKGSWLCLWLEAMGAQVSGLALAPDTELAHWNLLGLSDVRDTRVDIRDGNALRQALDAIQPEVIFHLAAQPLVRRSYGDPVTTFDTNVTGLVNLLEAVRSTTSVRALVNATTDKVYLDQPTTSGYREDHPLGGHDPYSTSKACAELVTDCYRKSFFSVSGPRMATARAGNVIGGGDWSEDRLVPDLVRAASTGTALSIRNPGAVRPWQHVLEPLSGYLRLGEALLTGADVEGAWNFGPSLDANLPVQELVTKMKDHWPEFLVEHDATPQPHEAGVLRLDCSKAAQTLGWRPVWNADDTLQRTSHWYRAYYEHGLICSRSDLRDYVAAAQVSGQGWAA
ncbi:CDP-glucose 4,6-dehydratase [Rhodanobacter sp. L36]|uniref:CDP-glucose 4,6-dehydratase n=1 Tax=Rhodanobacter sp. L36 TaxID=1747221 RepID=UPI00131C4BA0|nr:CDP-glucose 4,6-dehydratase [Rhodanobacter sp. L36]